MTCCQLTAGVGSPDADEGTNMENLLEQHVEELLGVWRVGLHVHAGGGDNSGGTLLILVGFFHCSQLLQIVPQLHHRLIAGNTISKEEEEETE